MSLIVPETAVASSALPVRATTQLASAATVIVQRS
jgi:hypothetical protein